MRFWYVSNFNWIDVELDVDGVFVKQGITIVSVVTCNEMISVVDLRSSV